MTPEKLLEKIASIQWMERGSIALNKPWINGGFFNHTVYENGKSRTRYVREDEIDELKVLIAAHNQFKELVRQYEDLVIQRTRAEREKIKRMRKKTKWRVRKKIGGSAMT